MLKTFTQLRRNTPASHSANKISFHSNNSDIQQISQELAKINKRKNSQVYGIKQQNKKGMFKKKEDCQKQWTLLHSQIKQQQEQFYTTIKTQPQQSRKNLFQANKKVLLNQKLPNKTQIGNQSNRNASTVKNKFGTQKVLKTKITIQQPIKATHMVSKRQRQKITARLKGLIDLVNSTEVAIDNIPEILTLIDKLGESIKKS